MRKEYISPSLTVVVLATEGLLATSDVHINTTGLGGGDQDTRKKEQTTDIWGNPQNKGIWD